MLVKNIVAFSLLAFQAGFGIAKPLAGHARREAAALSQDAPEVVARGSEDVPVLVAREDKWTESGTITGGVSDTVRTYGLSTCAGLAAVGDAGPGGINKVLAHVRCLPADGTYQDQANEWAQAVRDSGMTNIRIVVDIVNSALVPGPAQGVQNDINNAAKAAAQSIGSFATHTRQSLADPAPQGELKINIDGSITIGGNRVNV